MQTSHVWPLPPPALPPPVPPKDQARQAWAPQRWVRLLLLALVAWALGWGTPPSARAQEDPSHAASVALMWQGHQYLCAPAEPQSAQGEPYFCAPVEAQSPEVGPYLCAPVAPPSARTALAPAPGQATPAMMRMTCWIDDNGIRSCCQGTWCCSYIEGKWWCG